MKAPTARVNGIIATYRCDRGHDWTCWWAAGMTPYPDCCEVCMLTRGIGITDQQRFKAYRPIRTRPA
jgi:hypothetical protein